MSVLKYISAFILLALVQVLILNQVSFSGYLNPYIYILFVLYLPVTTPRAYVLLLCFALGLVIDTFENSGGIHASSTLLLGLVRLGLLKSASQRIGDDFENMRIDELGLVNLILYSGLGIFIHHFSLFMWEAFRFSDVGIVLLRTLYSTAFTLIFVLFIQLWNLRRRRS